MKRYLIICLIMITGLFSCDYDELVYDTPDGFIQTESESLSVVENSVEPVIVTILLGDGENESGVNVDFSVTSADPSRYSLTPSSGSVTIPAGQFSADLVLQPVDNFDVDGNATVTIALQSSSDKPIGIGGEGNFNTSTTVTIVDNDCPIDIESFVGTYDVAEVFTSGTNEGLTLAGAFGESYQLEMTLAPDDPSGTKVEINNSAGFNTYIIDGTIMTFDTCNTAIGFGGTVNIALFANMTISSSTYDEEANTVQANGPLGGFGPYQFIFTKQ